MANEKLFAGGIKVYGFWPWAVWFEVHTHSHCCCLCLYCLHIYAMCIYCCPALYQELCTQEEFLCIIVKKKLLLCLEKPKKKLLALFLKENSQEPRESGWRDRWKGNDGIRFWSRQKGIKKFRHSSEKWSWDWVPKGCWRLLTWKQPKFLIPSLFTFVLLYYK